MSVVMIHASPTDSDGAKKRDLTSENAWLSPIFNCVWTMAWTVILPYIWLNPKHAEIYSTNISDY